MLDHAPHVRTMNSQALSSQLAVLAQDVALRGLKNPFALGFRKKHVGQSRSIWTAKIPHYGRGSLKKLQEVPLEILQEIFSYLSPKDILNLARTSRHLRNILLSRQSRPTWKSAISNVLGLPSCPFDLSEPQYASLAFDNHCNFCSARVKKMIWTCRVRCCNLCRKNRFITEDELEFYLPHDIEITNPRGIFPYLCDSNTLHVKPEKVAYYLPSVEQYVHEMQTILANKNSDQSFEIWSEEKRSAQTRRIAHAALCEYWQTYWTNTDSNVHDFIVMLPLLFILAILWKGSILVAASRTCLF